VAFADRLGAKSIAQLRAMPAQAVNAAAPWNFTMNPMVTAFSPSIDHYVVPEVPAARFARGVQLHIPLLAGWNDAENYPFDAMGLPHRSAPEFRDTAEKMFGKAGLAAFLRLYPADTDAQANLSAAAFAGDIVIAEQTWQLLELQRMTGHAPVFGYKFIYTSPYTPIASHITEVPFLFGTLTPQFIIGSHTPPAAEDRAFSDQIMSYWVNFAAHGDPNGHGLPHWPAYTHNGQVQVLGKTIQPQANEQLTRFEFIASYRHNGVFPESWRSVP
jgi:para-nitrobenzyl esterase